MTDEREPAAPPVATSAGIDRPSIGAVRRRVLATVVLAGLLALGSGWGQDDDFPFGPLRQYSTATDPNGLVWATHAYGRFDDGEERSIGEGDIGMRVAEFDGQFHRLREDPELLRPLADTYHRRNPDGPRLVRLRVQRDAKRLQDREVVGRRTRIVAELWVAPEGEFESTRLFGRFSHEDERRLDPLELGMSRARFDRVVDGDVDGAALLERFAQDWFATNPADADKLTGLVLRRERVRIEDGNVVTSDVEVLAEADP